MPLMQLVQYRDKTFRLVDLRAVHPSGNKFFKLKRNIEHALSTGAETLLSFGGPWSNHIHALANRGAELGLNTVGVIRGERPNRLSAMLLDAESLGMKLHFISRQAYGHRESEGLDSLRQQFGDFYLVPEGGSNELGIAGAGEIVELLEDIQFEHVFIAVGTGGTLAGIANALPETTQVVGVSALKGEDTLSSFISTMTEANNWTLDFSGHCGGYARCPDDLRDFILDFEADAGISLEPVYSGKMIYRMLQLMEERPELNGKQTVAIHTGGMQGRRGFDF